MNITIVGQHMSIGGSLQEYVNEKLQYIIKRYFDHAISGNVHFVKQGHLFTCDIVVHDGTGRHTFIKSNSSCDDVYSAFDVALAKCEKQLRRYKSKLKDRTHKIKASQTDLAAEAIKYVIAPHRDDVAIEEDHPLIIAEKSTHLEFLTVSEAVMKMDLENLPAVMFKNSKNGRLNVVYHREDGNISWVDSVQ
jgi:ribosomal subunit interface protein